MLTCFGSCLGARFEPSDRQPITAGHDASMTKIKKSKKITSFLKETFVVSLEPIPNHELPRSMVNRSPAEKLEIQKISMDLLRYSINPTSSSLSKFPKQSQSPLLRFSNSQEIIDPTLISPRSSIHPTHLKPFNNQSPNQIRLSVNRPIVHDRLSSS